VTEITAANRKFLKKHAPEVGAEFTVEHGYDIRSVIKKGRDGIEFVHDIWKSRGDRVPEVHLERLRQSGHIILLEEVSIKSYDERPPRKGAPPMHMQTGYSVRQTFRRRK
jgi:hypothetical protein